jgi:RNase P subunit RPR2
VKAAENGIRISQIQNTLTLATENVNMKDTHLATNFIKTVRNGSTQDTVAHGKEWKTKIFPQQFCYGCKSTAPVNNKTGAVHSD